MDAQSILISQIQTLKQELGRTENALNSPQIDPALQERVRIRFDNLISQQRTGLNAVQLYVNNGQQPLELCWSRFQDIRQDCAHLFRECLAFIQGALVRRAGLDNGLCRIADALLDDLSYLTDIPWDRFTLLAEEEFFHDMAEIIRLRFPDVSIWNLPIAAHEFGHFIGPKLEEHGLDGKSRHPFQDLLEIERMHEPRYWSFLHEHFADIFATYALGPAFACTCILQRFNEGNAYDDHSNHPSFAKRVYCILQVLSNMDKKDGFNRPYEYIIDALTALWQQYVVATRQSASLADDIAIPLDVRTHKLCYLVESKVPRVRYEGWWRAQRISNELAPDTDLAPMSQNGDTLADVLNAAWLCRLRGWDNNDVAVRQIGDRAYNLCCQIINTRGR